MIFYFFKKKKSFTVIIETFKSFRVYLKQKKKKKQSLKGCFHINLKTIVKPFYQFSR